jgi:hypothetical protein
MYKRKFFFVWHRPINTSYKKHRTVIKYEIDNEINRVIIGFKDTNSYGYPFILRIKNWLEQKNITYKFEGNNETNSADLIIHFGLNI